MVRASGMGETSLTPVLEADRWLRSPDHQQVMRVVIPREDDGVVLAQVEVRSVLGGLPSVRRLTAQAAIRTWNGCRQHGWMRCHPQW